jgi:hypothetical protein
MSLEEDVYAYLAADTILATLLGATAIDAKIYPLFAPTETGGLPHIVYSSPGEGSPDELLDGMRLTFKITTDNDYEQANAIKEQLNKLLDFKQSQKNLNIPSSDFNIYDSQKNGKTDDYDKEAKLVIKVLNYDIKYITKTF